MDKIFQPENTNWDNELMEYNGHFLQSLFWINFQKNLKNKIFTGIEDNFMYFGYQIKTRFENYLYLPYGPTAKNQKGMRDAIDFLHKFAQHNKFDYLKIEPIAEGLKLKDFSSLKKTKDRQPEWTNLLDLEDSQDQIFKNLSSGHRYAIRHIGDRNLEFKLGDAKDLGIFFEMMKETEQRAGITGYPKKYFQTLLETESTINKKNIKIYFTYCKNEPVCGAIVFDWRNTRYYAFAGAFQELNRKIQGSVALVWEMIIDAKKQGFRYFDFWGVAPPDAKNHKWQGISYFKRAFGGQNKQYFGTWDFPVNKTKYNTLQALKKLRS